MSKLENCPLDFQWELPGDLPRATDFHGDISPNQPAHWEEVGIPTFI